MRYKKERIRGDWAKKERRVNWDWKTKISSNRRTVKIEIKGGERDRENIWGWITC